MNQSTEISPIQRFWCLLKPDRKEITNVYLYSIFNGLVNLSLPLGIQAIINLIQGGQVSTSWIILVILVVLGIGLTGVLQIFQMRIVEDLKQKIFSRSAFEFAFRIPRIRMEALYRHHAPELMNRFFDTMTVQKGLSSILIDFTSAVLQVLFGLLLLSLYHPFFILFGIALVALVFAIFRFTARRGLKTSLEESRNKYRLAHWLEELARMHTTFKLAGKTEIPLNRADNYVGKYLDSREGHFKVLIQQFSLMVLFKVVVATGLLAIGGVLVIQNQMNIGQFVAAEIIILLVLASVEKLIVSLETIYDVITALEKIGQVTDMELEKFEGVDLCEESEGDGLHVQMEEVFFTYPSNKRVALKNVNLEAKSGDRIVLTGGNGSGKSTLLQILAGLYHIQDGRLFYNGIARSSVLLDSLRTLIGDCLSQELLFEGSLMENIGMGREAATISSVKWAVKVMQLDEFVRSLPDGLETQLDAEGRRLPRSIIQKILLARAIADKPKLILLEDALEHIEEHDRRLIIDFLTAKENGWTLIAVSADHYLAKKSDCVVIMNDGEIQQKDSYEELKSSNHFNS